MYRVVVASASSGRSTVAQPLECEELGAEQALLGEQQSLPVHGGSGLRVAQQLVLGRGSHFERLLLLIVAKLGQVERIQKLK